MAAGVAHEINNPLTILNVISINLRKSLEQGKLTDEWLLDSIKNIEQTVMRISKIVMGLRTLSRDSANEEMDFCNMRA
jgi:phosphoglycerate-specific signal transduction histidine kinase